MPLEPLVLSSGAMKGAPPRVKLFHRTCTSCMFLSSAYMYTKERRRDINLLSCLFELSSHEERATKTVFTFRRLVTSASMRMDRHSACRTHTALSFSNIGCVRPFAVASLHPQLLLAQCSCVRQPPQNKQPLKKKMLAEQVYTLSYNAK